MFKSEIKPTFFLFINMISLFIDYYNMVILKTYTFMSHYIE